MEEKNKIISIKKFTKDKIIKGKIQKRTGTKCQNRNLAKGNRHNLLFSIETVK